MEINQLTIFVPQRLLDATESSFPNIRTIENHLLFWVFIDAWPYFDEIDGWKQIHDSRFTPVTKNQNDRGKIRKWLRDNGFIRIQKFKTASGILRDDYLPGREAMKYATICKTPLVAYNLQSKNFWSRFEATTGDDKMSRLTRENLSLLREYRPKKLVYESKNEESRKKNRDISSIFKLNFNVGPVNLGGRVDRLYSPWVGASKQVRARYQLNGCPIVNLDLKAAQPTLLSVLANDRKFRLDCKSDAVYQGIGELLGVDRNDAKKAYMAYAYGRNRGGPGWNPAAFKIQEWMKQKYPITADFVYQHKQQHHYSELSCELQSLEASICISGVLAETAEKGIPALSIHDSISVGDQYAIETEEISHKHISEIIPVTEYTLTEESISNPNTTWTSSV